MKFLNYVKYADLNKIADARRSHFDYADRLREHGNLAVGGPLLDEKAGRIGLLFIYEAASRDAAVALAEDDPFTRAGALRSYEITEWRLRGVSLDLLSRANRSGDQSMTNTRVRLFTNYAKYSLNTRRLAAVRPAHWAYDQALERGGKMALAGPFASDDGGLFVYNAPNREEAAAYLQHDPFAIRGVFGKYELLEWLIEGVNPRLLTRDF